MNYITIAGHMGTDPEVRFTSGGQKVTTLRVASNSRKSGKEETIWWRITIWGENFDKMMPYLKKGSAIMVMGELAKPEIFNDREGRPQISMNITAHNITFSPFGRGNKENEMPQKQEQKQPAFSGGFGGGQQQGQEQQQGQQGGGFNDSMMFGGGQGAPATPNEEIPF